MKKLRLSYSEVNNLPVPFPSSTKVNLNRRTLYCTSCGGLVAGFFHECKAQTFEQGSTSWLAWRMGGIGASDAPAVMNASPWMTPYELWKIKTGRLKPQPANSQMLRGRAMESLARIRYQQMTGIEVPASRAEHAKYDFMRASLDGANHEIGKIVEIKCPGKVDHQKALDGKITTKYVWQLVQILAVTGMSEIDYFSFDGKEGVIVTFRRNKKMEKQLIAANLKFWDCVLRDVPPPVEIFKMRKG